jgi:hypothetical protein
VADPGAWHIQRQIRRFERDWHQQHASAAEGSGG